MAYTPIKKPKRKFRIPNPKRPAPGKKRAKVQFKQMMKILLDAEMGDPQKRKQEFYQKHLKRLNRQELNRLMKKIHKIAQSSIEGSDDKVLFLEMENFVHDTIEPLLSKSFKYVEKLNKKINKRLKSLRKVKMTADKKIRYDRKVYSFREFVELYFTELVKEYNDFVERGYIIPDRFEKRGSTFVRNAIKARLG